MPPPQPFAESPEFLRLLRGDGAADLTLVALEIARDAYPAMVVADQVARIDALADRVKDRCPSGARPRHILGQINWILFVEEQFRGNTEDYDDPRNSYLNRVLERKAGIPISLSALYLAIADRLGLAMSGVNLPAHFVIRTAVGAPEIFVDPFHGGTLLDRDGCRAVVASATGLASVDIPEAAFDPCPTREVVARMLRNLKATYLRARQYAPALPVLRRLTALSRGAVEDRRDLGIAAAMAGRPGDALAELSAYLEARPRAEDAREIADLLRSARRDISSRN